MRHKRHGRTLGRTSSHRQALYRNLATALFLTERPDADLVENAPKVKGRIVTTLPKAKEVRPFVEKCVTIAKKGLAAQRAAEEFGTSAERNSSEWKNWRESANYRNWLQANAPAVNARRRLFALLRSKQAVSILMDDIAERFEDRPGGYTRIMRLATPRLGDAGPRAILEFVGKHDRVVKRSEKPEFGSQDEEELADQAVEDQQPEATDAKAAGESADQAASASQADDAEQKG